VRAALFAGSLRIILRLQCSWWLRFPNPNDEGGWSWPHLTICTLTACTRLYRITAMQWVLTLRILLSIWWRWSGIFSWNVWPSWVWGGQCIWGQPHNQHSHILHHRTCFCCRASGPCPWFRKELYGLRTTAEHYDRSSIGFIDILPPNQAHKSTLC